MSLTKHTVFAAVAVCGVGLSESSPPSDITTCATSPPSDVSMYQAFQRQIEVIWNMPTIMSEGLAVKKYKIKYQPAHQGGNVNVKESCGDECFYRIEDLLPDTSYLVSVSVDCSEDRESAYSTPVEMKTLPRIATQIFRDIRSTNRLMRVELPLTRSNNTSGDYRVYYFGDKALRGKKTHRYHGRWGF